MAWMNQLYWTFENNFEESKESDRPMASIAHMFVHAQIEITLDEAGNFQSATVVPKQDDNTLIPVTEASASRSSGVAPHPLCDTLSYIAGDFGNYCKSEKEKKKAKEKFESYIQALNQWLQSEYTHSKVKSIHSYLARGSVISDLVKAGIVELDNEFFTNKKINGQPYEKAMVRFRILSNKIEDKSACWEDQALFQAYIDYYLSNKNRKAEICYYTGRKQIISENHPKGIVAASNGAKLISANDEQGYAYRGRFQNAEQSYALSYEASQKIHSALSWLVKKQGVYVGKQDKRTFVCWNPQGKETPDVLNPFDFFDEDQVEEIGIGEYRKKLFQTLQGYQKLFDEEDEVIVMGLDAATTGRLSITYYSEFMAHDFYERIVHWGETCNWWYLKFDEQKRPYYRIQTSVFRRIAECAFGRETDKFIEADDRIVKEQVQRLLKCMLDRQPLPFDIVQALKDRASTPLAYNTRNREMVLSTACAVIIKYYYDKRRIKKGESNYMKLDLENRDRSYLFGRLLAVLEKVERVTYDRTESRDPNAIRLQSAYVNHPMQTWKILEDMLTPYFQKLAPGSREYYRRLISEIIMLFQEEDQQVMNQALKENYLLGYYLQRAELNKKKEEKKEEI